ncbi:hypothetical protein H0A36_07185 [Endozoicomonas sp. SM1973]|uniref:Lipoprotein n=1 Tax=Spartinivicinus marinus TaxID=2994442 RepID=A0A853HX18_9GAMM|nr:hypothetical protein [Spartinivicinus marinus]MCX4025800.1 hypothetical protein [Spartinivicinus marinus]NYZ65793.1 hypothetical protein [Spartinivicinus marinus]
MKRSKTVKLVLMGLAPIALTACDDEPNYEYMTLNECIDYVRAVDKDSEFDLDILIGPGYSRSKLDKSFYKYREKKYGSSYTSSKTSSTSSNKTTTSSRSGFGSSASARGSWGRSSWGG